jgi:hypothetical protein
MLDGQPPVVAIDRLDRRAVLRDAAGGEPAVALDPRVLERAVQPELLELVRVRGATPRARR